MEFYELCNKFGHIGVIHYQPRFCPLSVHYIRERSGSVVECLNRDRGAAGSSLTGVTVLCP